MPRTLMLLTLAVVACRSGDDGGTKDTAEDTTDTTSDPEPQTVRWLQTADWGWVQFNHRVSHLELRAEPPEAAIIGGTSTTGVNRTLPDGCEAASCKEFPVRDSSLVEVVVAEVTTTELRFAEGSIDVLADADGETQTLSVPDPGGDGEVVAVLQGFALDSAHPLDGPEACYDPALGWHPTALGLELLDARREGDELMVDVRATFGAGVTEDPDRVCVDEVHDQALVPFTVEVLFVVGDGGTSHPVHQEAYHAFSGDAFDPGEQTDPAPVTLSTEGDGLMGWSSVSYRFNTDSEAGRGAYIRTMRFGVDGTQAHGTATNYSPITQLHDFGFVFDGVVEEVPVEGVQRTTYTATLPADLESSGEAVVFDLTDPPAEE